MPKISASVGLNQVNHKGDVKTVQALLNRNAPHSSTHTKLALDGLCGPGTQQGIAAFQTKVLDMSPADAVVSPHGFTLRALSLHAAPHRPTHARSKPRNRPISPTASADPTKPATGAAPGAVGQGALSEEDYVDAARALNCETAAIKAVVETEVKIRGAFDSEGRPTILFERHFFSRLSGGRFDKSDPEISNPTPGGYGRFSEQYPKLEQAMKLDRDAALRSASWGAFQIMGDNCGAAGFGSVDAVVEAMKASVQSQIAAFVQFVKSNPVILHALQNKNWTRLARHYNGPGYAANQYDCKMQQNYEKFSKAI